MPWTPCYKLDYPIDAPCCVDPTSDYHTIDEHHGCSSDSVFSDFKAAKQHSAPLYAETMIEGKR